MQIIVVTGLSGSGKSIVIRQLEDSGYYCIDNLPVAYITPVIDSLHADGLTRVAVAIDSRTRANPGAPRKKIQELKEKGYSVKVLSLTASTPCLVQRFSETRRRHPLTPLDREPGDQSGLQEAIKQERAISDLQIGFLLDTTDMSTGTLKKWVRDFIQAPPSELTISFESFAYKKGIPVAADFVFDVRNLPNPYYQKELRPLTGKDAPVQQYLEADELTSEMLDDLDQFIRKWIPSYRNQGRHYLTVCIGCTGGQHRSVYIAEKLFERFAQIAGVVVRHRELDNHPG